jgi:hypothetical protein
MQLEKVTGEGAILTRLPHPPNKNQVCCASMRKTCRISKQKNDNYQGLLIAEFSDRLRPAHRHADGQHLPIDAHANAHRPIADD